MVERLLSFISYPMRLKAASGQNALGNVHEFFECESSSAFVFYIRQNKSLEDQKNVVFHAMTTDYKWFRSCDRSYHTNSNPQKKQGEKAP